MNVQPMAVEKEAALLALREYRQHRSVYDKRDWEIERIYRAISKGRTVISVQDAIVRAGVDGNKRPRLAICQAHAEFCVCSIGGDKAVFGIATEGIWRPRVGRIEISWPGVQYADRCIARLPRIPPRHRPVNVALSGYHMLWEADWTDIPRDPYLLKRIGKDAWVVVAAWDLTDVEISVLRAHQAH